MRTPYHEGELAVQRRLGVEAMAAKIGRGIHAELPPAAVEFLAARSFVIVAAANEAGEVWASPLVGAPGFLHAESPRALAIDAALHAGDPLRDALTRETKVGLLAIDFATRRRVRVNGVARLRRGGGLALEVEQAYANCPRFIHRRLPTERTAALAPQEPARSRTLTSAQQAWIASTDTFFVATAHAERGADASHRGGPPGVVGVLDERTLAWPEYAGNTMLQTLGNLAVDPACGLLLVDFGRGATLQVTGRATLLWDAPARAGAQAAVCGVRLELDAVVETAGAFPAGWSDLETSIENAPT
ncbi:MAG TPA: pyridoxamine 5'-phosphate oxidase family protein [Candidatus Binatia bacterium]